MSKLLSFISGFFLIGLFFSVLGAQWGGVENSRYQFLPAQQNLWVVDHKKGGIVFFKFPDTEDRSIQRSKTYSVDRKRFPKNETTFVLSKRSMSSILWIVNDKTGEVQVLRYRRDGTFASEFQLQVARQFDYK